MNRDYRDGRVRLISNASRNTLARPDYMQPGVSSEDMFQERLATSQATMGMPPSATASISDESAERLVGQGVVLQPVIRLRAPVLTGGRLSASIRGGKTNQVELAEGQTAGAISGEHVIATAAGGTVRAQFLGASVPNLEISGDVVPGVGQSHSRSRGGSESRGTAFQDGLSEAWLPVNAARSPAAEPAALAEALKVRPSNSSLGINGGIFDYSRHYGSPA